MAVARKKRVKIEDLMCGCRFPDKYLGGSGLAYCHQCGGIADRKETRDPDDIGEDVTLFGAAALFCQKCSGLSWAELDVANKWELVINQFHKVQCPSCGEYHKTKGIKRIGKK